MCIRDRDNTELSNLAPGGCQREDPWKFSSEKTILFSKAIFENSSIQMSKHFKYEDGSRNTHLIRASEAKPSLRTPFTRSKSFEDALTIFGIFIN